MTDQQQSDIQGQLVDLNRDVGGLTATIAAFNEAWQRQDRAASQGRQRLYERFEAFQREVLGQLGRLTRRVESLESKVKVIKPSVDAFNAEKLRDEGSKRLGVKIWGAMLAAAAVLGWGIHEASTWAHELFTTVLGKGH